MKSHHAGAEEELLNKNKKLVEENNTLRQEYCKLQEAHMKDKSKIQTLIGKLSEFRTDPAFGQSKKSGEKTCENSGCLERRKYLELELHRERMKVFELEEEKKTW